ncbi:MAG: VCBS repeat-containing protein [Thermoguttaceae bacterium]|nr:VCBS repeat-containing protein [Thermoguttaceae bacterium]MDW8080258.1 VCBS repeat-containing protein [Thermoguttaceae bacterium]
MASDQQSLVEEQIRLFCGDCHAVPKPESFPKARWYTEVRIGYQQYVRSGRDDLVPPSIAQVVEYYRNRAPETFTFRLPVERSKGPPIPFEGEDVAWERSPSGAPAVAGLLFQPPQPGSSPSVIVSDMRSGLITAVFFDLDKVRGKPLARLNFPCRVERFDLGGSRAPAFVVAELGSFFAYDHDQGKVVLLQPQGENEAYVPIVLADGLGRVADIRVGDVDNDGDLDILVAEFGHYVTGSITLLINEGVVNGRVTFSQRRLDPRSGTVHVRLFDFNGDGLQDFFALISNEWESIELFVNRGQGNFLARPIWRGPDLTFGLSGLELVDLDRDGDIDLLFTNGDSFDNLYANPWHGVQWLENVGSQGENPFRYHRLLDLPGAYRAVSGDIDGDEDLDIVVSAWLPRRVMPESLRHMDLPSLVILEQRLAGQFQCHILERSWPQFPILLVEDLDSDGDLDIMAGRHTGLDELGTEPSFPLRVFWNRRKAPSPVVRSETSASVP